jgi:hypothetical protein
MENLEYKIIMFDVSEQTLRAHGADITDIDIDKIPRFIVHYNQAANTLELYCSDKAKKHTELANNLQLFDPNVKAGGHVYLDDINDLHMCSESGKYGGLPQKFAQAYIPLVKQALEENKIPFREVLAETTTFETPNKFWETIH